MSTCLAEFQYLLFKEAWQAALEVSELGFRCYALFEMSVRAYCT